VPGQGEDNETGTGPIRMVPSWAVEPPPDPFYAVSEPVSLEEEEELSATEPRAGGGRSAQRRRKKRLHWWNRGSGIRLRLWMTVHIVVLAVLSYGVIVLVRTPAIGATYAGLGSAGHAPGFLARLKLAGQQQKPQQPVIPTAAQFASPDGLYFGTATPHAPYQASEVDQAGQNAGARPNMTEYFVKWTQGLDTTAVSDAYLHGTLPVITWEPWATGVQTVGNANGGTTKTADMDQPAYRLANIADGKFDGYITSFAKSVAAEKWPIALRFAHEMNGNWYPWSEQENGNHKGDYVKAWRHVHDLFQQAGASNVIWVWSPNIVRPVKKVALAPLYPGDQYVDWIGLTGYQQIDETSPDQTFDPTLKIIRKFTSKPVLVTETGAQPGPYRVQWIQSFFPWLTAHPYVIGFVWTERDTSTGSNADWRFDSTPATEQAFRTGLATVRLAKGARSQAVPTGSPSPDPTATSSAPAEKTTHGSTSAGTTTHKHTSAGTSPAAQETP
jgi:beta-mannanase